MGDADAELLAAATSLLDRVYVAGRHEVVAAMRTADGMIHLGVHVDGSARRSSVCAEGVAAGIVVAHGATAQRRGDLGRERVAPRGGDDTRDRAVRRVRRIAHRLLAGRGGVGHGRG